MPGRWQPSRDAPWSEREGRDAKYAIRIGLNEMIHFYQRRPAAVRRLDEDSVASLIEVTYASANPPSLDATARAAARRNLTILMAPYLRRNSGRCDEYEQLLPLAIFAGARSSHVRIASPEVAKVVRLTNASYRACGSLKAAMGQPYKQMLNTKNVNPNAVFDLVIWSLALIEAELVPGLQLSAEERAFSPALWHYLRTYPLRDARTYRGGAFNQQFIDMAYLATHIAYIPTGNHRHRLYVQDSPSLYRFLRQNFYPVLQMGELDLVAEFVDSLRQYGYTEKNDRQVREGTRYLLKVFHTGGDRWMAYREPGETDKDVHSYDAIHKAWTGIAGVRARTFEPVKPGTYGSIVRRWLPYPVRDEKRAYPRSHSMRRKAA
jgi:hypothetical protein